MILKLPDITNELILKIMVMLIASPVFSFSQIMTVNGNTAIYLNQGSILAVKGGLDLKSGSTIVHDNSGISNLYISGKFNYLGTYTQNNYGILRFYSNLQDTISGNNPEFNRLWIDKSGTGMLTLNCGSGMTVHESLRLISDNLLNIDRSDLIIDSTAVIYPDSTSSYLTDPLTDPFSDNKHITSSGDSSLSGKLIRRIKKYDSLSTDLSLRFPIGTPNDTITQVQRFYTPVSYVFKAGKAKTGLGAFISVQNIASEHYATEVKGVSLKKYWKVACDSVSVEPGGYNVSFNYNQGEVQGNEDLYNLSLFFRPHDGLTGQFYLNPGTGYDVDDVNNRFYVDEVNKKDTLDGTLILLDGEWTAGQENVISTFYYSRENGDWFNPSTWSKQGYDSIASLTYPRTNYDKVFIGNSKTVSVVNSTPEINRTIIDFSGRLLITNPNAIIQGDSLYLLNGGTLAVSSPDGFHASGVLGNVRTTKIRSYSGSAVYEFVGSGNQVTGPGIPDIVSAVVINKDASTDTVSLTKSVLIKDSLVINQGICHLFLNGDYSLNGETEDTTNRQIKMRGGELITQSFPVKFADCFFTAGTITFDGTCSFRVPSSECQSPGEPVVSQYYNLSLKGGRGTNTFITFDTTGQIRIGGLLDIAKLSFNPAPFSDRFLVTGSKVVFNAIGNQDIQTGYSAPTEINFRLKFHDLIIDGPGIKNILAPNDYNPDDNFALIRSDVHIKQGTLKSNNHNIKVLGNWLAEPGSTYDAGSGLVTFEADDKVTSIESNGIPFNNVRIMGTNGFVNFTDSLNIAGNLEINLNTLRSVNGASLAIQGSWLNKGIFESQTGRVYFNGIGDQTLDHNGFGDFYSLTVNKPEGMVRLDGDSLIQVINDLTLSKGNIGGRLSDSVADKPIVVEGTITRPGGTPGHVDGCLIKQIEADSNISSKFEIGYGALYMPATIDLSSGTGAAGMVAGCVNSTSGANLSRIHPTKRIDYFWVISPWSTFDIGTRSVNTTFQMPASQLANLTGGEPNDANLLRRSIPTENPSWVHNPYAHLTWNVSLASVSITTPENYWTGLGEFYISEEYSPTFYSRQSGNWNDNNTWTLGPGHSGVTVLAGDYPNSDILFKEDNVYIGLNHIVTLNIPETQIDTLIVRNDSKLDMGINAINCDECAPIKGLFDLQNNATIAFGGSNIPSSLTTMKNFVVYGLSPNSTIEYTGIQIITPAPFSPAASFTNYPGNVRISGLDSKYVNLAVLVNGNFYVNTGASIEVNADALKIYGNFYNSGNIFNTNIIEIGN